MPVPCARCDTHLPQQELAGGDSVTCYYCGSSNQVRLFPALLSPLNVPVPTEGALEGEASCYDHPSKRAVASCHQCGRFVCRLCSVESGAEIWCPSCVAAGAGKARSANLDASRTLYDSTALILPLLSLVLYPFTLVAAPASLVLTAIRWNRPISLVRRNRWRFVAAILISVTEICLWTIGIYYLVSGRFRSQP
jgi:hypothetical protein